MTAAMVCRCSGPRTCWETTTSPPNWPRASAASPASPASPVHWPRYFVWRECPGARGPAESVIPEGGTVAVVLLSGGFLFSDLVFGWVAALKRRENPERTAAQVQRILRASSGWARTWASEYLLPFRVGDQGLHVLQ